MNSNPVKLARNFSNGSIFSNVQASSGEVSSLDEAWTRPFSFFNILNKKKLFNKAELISTEVAILNAKSGCFYWIKSGFPESIWSALPITSHRLITPNYEIENSLITAIDHLFKVHEAAFEIFKTFVNCIVWTEIDPRIHGKIDEITSSTFPILPFCVFVSNKALKHIPPNAVSPESSFRFLAENLLHEAVHQQVNVTLLEKDVFVSSYRSSSSPKIEIKWRANQGIARNQFWELDRVLHAIYVYIEVSKYRIVELESNEISDLEKKYFALALKTGKVALNYLLSEVLLFRDYFTIFGNNLLDGLEAEIAKIETFEMSE